NFQALYVSDVVFVLVEPGVTSRATVTSRPASHSRFSQRGAGLGGGGLGGSVGGPDLAGLDIGRSSQHRVTRPPMLRRRHAKRLTKLSAAAWNRGSPGPGTAKVAYSCCASSSGTALAKL